MDELTEEFLDWCAEHGIIPQCAHEMLMCHSVSPFLTTEEVAWVNGFIERWDRQQAIVDRLENLMTVMA